ncbi:MAG: hypothetical protein AAB362_01050 [Patescibacteria group bacterium]
MPAFFQSISSYAGWIGMILILLGYYLISSGRVDGKSRLYHAINFLGAFGITINVLVQNALPTVVLNVVFALIALWGLLRKNKISSD